MRVLFAALVLGAALPAAGESSLPSPVGASAERIVENFRRIIVLHESAGPGQRHRHAPAGQYLFFQNRELAAQLVEALVTPTEGRREANLAGFLDAFGARSEWRDIDRLALAGVINEALLRLPQHDPMLPRLRLAADEIARIRSLYNREITAALADRPNAAPTRPEWSAYISFLRQRYPIAKVLEELQAALTEAAPPALSPGMEAAAKSALSDEWTDGGLPPRTILLTFDDGPHPRFTAQILRILERYGVKAIFFQVGRNLGTVRSGAVEELRHQEIVAQVLREGHAIGNHTYTHPFLPRMDEIGLAQEIDFTEALLTAAAGTAGRAPVFRPPYGARNDLVLADLAERGLRSVLWNIDSRDWADPIPGSVAHRVVEEAERQGHGIVLFHDIHNRAVLALPTVIEELRKRGFRFARWDGTRLVVDATP